MKRKIILGFVLLLALLTLTSCNFFDWAAGKYAAEQAASEAYAAQSRAQAEIEAARQAALAAAAQAQAQSAASIHAETESSVRLLAFLAVVNSQAGLGMSLTFLFGIFLCVVVVFVVSVRRSR